MPSPLLLKLYRDPDLTAEALLAAAKPSQLVDSLDVADELAALERLPAEHRLEDVSRVFWRVVADRFAAGHGPLRAAEVELVQGLAVVVRRTLAELKAAA